MDRLSHYFASSRFFRFTLAIILAPTLLGTLPLTLASEKEDEADPLVVITPGENAALTDGLCQRPLEINSAPTLAEWFHESDALYDLQLSHRELVFLDQISRHPESEPYPGAFAESSEVLAARLQNGQKSSSELLQRSHLLLLAVNRLKKTPTAVDLALLRQDPSGFLMDLGEDIHPHRFVRVPLYPNPAEAVNPDPMRSIQKLEKSALLFARHAEEIYVFFTAVHDWLADISDGSPLTQGEQFLRKALAEFRRGTMLTALSDPLPHLTIEELFSSSILKTTASEFRDFFDELDSDPANINNKSLERISEKLATLHLEVTRAESEAKEVYLPGMGSLGMTQAREMVATYLWIQRLSALVLHLRVKWTLASAITDPLVQEAFYYAGYRQLREAVLDLLPKSDGSFVGKMMFHSPTALHRQFLTYAMAAYVDRLHAARATRMVKPETSSHFEVEPWLLNTDVMEVFHYLHRGVVSKNPELLANPLGHVRYVTKHHALTLSTPILDQSHNPLQRDPNPPVVADQLIDRLFYVGQGLLMKIPDVHHGRIETFRIRRFLPGAQDLQDSLVELEYYDGELFLQGRNPLKVVTVPLLYLNRADFNDRLAGPAIRQRITSLLTAGGVTIFGSNRTSGRSN